MSGDTAEEIASRLLTRLGDAWNAGDGTAFGEPFAADADFVAIRGDYHRGRDAIGQGHQALFDTIYEGSTVEYLLRRARALTDEVIVVHAQGRLKAPTGPLTGEHTSTMTLVVARRGREADWQIVAFQNTLVVPPQ